MKTIVLSNARSIQDASGNIKYLLKRKAPKGHQRVNELFQAYIYNVNTHKISGFAVVNIEQIDLEYIKWAHKQSPSGTQLPITEKIASCLMRRAGLQSAKNAYLVTILKMETYKKEVSLRTITDKQMFGEFIYVR